MVGWGVRGEGGVPSALTCTFNPLRCTMKCNLVDSCTAREDLCCGSEKLTRRFCSLHMLISEEIKSLFFWLSLVFFFVLEVMSLLSHSRQITFFFSLSFFFRSSTFSCPRDKKHSGVLLAEPCLCVLARSLLCDSQPSPRSLRPVFNPVEAAAAAAAATVLKHPGTRPATSARHYSKLQE